MNNSIIKFDFPQTGNFSIKFLIDTMKKHKYSAKDYFKKNFSFIFELYNNNNIYRNEIEEILLIILEDSFFQDKQVIYFLKELSKDKYENLNSICENINKDIINLQLEEFILKYKLHYDSLFYNFVEDLYDIYDKKEIYNENEFNKFFIYSINNNIDLLKYFPDLIIHLLNIFAFSKNYRKYLSFIIDNVIDLKNNYYFLCSIDKFLISENSKKFIKNRINLRTKYLFYHDKDLDKMLLSELIKIYKECKNLSIENIEKISFSSDKILFFIYFDPFFVIIVNDISSFFILDYKTIDNIKKTIELTSDSNNFNDLLDIIKKNKIYMFDIGKRYFFNPILNRAKIFMLRTIYQDKIF